MHLLQLPFFTATLSEQAYTEAIKETSSELKKYAADIESGSCVVDFGAKSDALCGAAAQVYGDKAPAPKDAGEQKIRAAKVRPI